MNNKTGLIILIVLMIVTAGVGIFLLTKNTQTQTKPTQQPPTTAGNTSSKITLAEIANHNNPDDCWFAIDGAVYDVSSFVNKHPGGKDILAGCGKDATSLFHNREGKEDHSNRAKNMLPEYKIGELVN